MRKIRGLVRLGELLREAREYKRLTQEEAAQQVGIHWVTVSRYERGEQQPRAATLERIYEVYDLSPSAQFEAFEQLPKSERVKVSEHELELIRMYREASPSLCASTFEGLTAGLRLEQRQAESQRATGKKSADSQTGPERG